MRQLSGSPDADLAKIDQLTDLLAPFPFEPAIVSARWGGGKAILDNVFGGVEPFSRGSFVGSERRRMKL
jgi:hypothetical protein